MPVMGGLETAKILRFTQSGPSPPPLVALTADATQESRKACEEAGFDAYLTKPVEIKKLLELLDSLVPSGRKSLDTSTTAQAPAAGISLPEGVGSTPAIDPATFNELAALEKRGDFLTNLIRIFLQTGEEKIEKIEQALIARQYGHVSDFAHALKGSAGQIGATTLMELCNRMSHLGPADLMEDGTIYADGIKKEFAQVRAALQRFADQAERSRTSGVISPPRSSDRGSFRNLLLCFHQTLHQTKVFRSKIQGGFDPDQGNVHHFSICNRVVRLPNLVKCLIGVTLSGVFDDVFV
jgi:two-component system sensor histidine kinase RpfC